MSRSSLDTAASTHRPLARVQTGRRIAILALGDALMFVLFAAIGRRQHGETSGLAALAEISATALPFAVGWFVLAPGLGAYRRRRTNTVPRMLLTTETIWLLAWPVALLLRWLFAADHRVPVSFALVILVANAVLLGGWRGLVAAVELAWRLAGGRRSAT